MITRGRVLTVALLAPVVTWAAEFDAAVATNQVGLDLMRQLDQDGRAQNLVISPYSIEAALALAYAGADGTTRAEMQRVLRFPAEEADARAGIRALASTLSRSAGGAPTNDEKRRSRPSANVEWHAANRLYGQAGYPFRPEFVSLLRDGYAAPFEPLDFGGDTLAARRTINDWVGDQTQGRIRDLIPAGGLTPNTRLLLVNALYLKARWNNRFDRADTAPRPFHFSDGKVADVETMHQTAYYGYAREAGATVVALPYVGREFHCLVILPDEGTTPARCLEALTPDDLARWARLGVREQELALSLPKFRLELPTLRLGATLRALGLRSAFDDPSGSANFERVAPRRAGDYLALAEIFHRTFVALDEAGTEAAAATAIQALTLGMKMPNAKPLEVRIDRPFLFVIQHRATGATLFLGQISDPRAR